MCVVYVCRCGRPRAAATRSERKIAWSRSTTRIALSRSCEKDFHSSHSPLRANATQRKKKIFEQRPLRALKNLSSDLLPPAQVWPLRCQRLSMKYVSVHRGGAGGVESMCARVAIEICGKHWRCQLLISAGGTGRPVHQLPSSRAQQCRSTVIGHEGEVYI